MPMVTAPIQPSAAAHGVRPAPDVKTAAKNFERVFVSEMLKTAHIGLKSGDGPTDDAFGGFASDAFAQALTERGGIGLAAPIERALLQRQSSTPGGEHP